MPMSLSSTRVVVGEPIGERLRDRVRLLVDLLQHEGRVARLFGGILVPRDLLDLALDRLAGRAAELDAEPARTVTISSSPTSCTRRVSRRKAGIAEATKCSPSPTPITSGQSLRAPTIVSGSSARHRDERVVAAQVEVREARRLGQVSGAERLEVLLDQVRDRLCVGLGGEVVALGLELPRAARRSSR